MIGVEEDKDKKDNDRQIEPDRDKKDKDRQR